MTNLLNKIYGLYEENKKIVNIVLILIFILLIFLLLNNFVFNKEPNQDNPSSNPGEVLQVQKITLFGDLEITINQDEEYVEPGYYAITTSGEIKTDEVEVTNTVDTSKPGTYIITYSLGDKKVTRTVVVLEKKEIGNLVLTLQGNSLIVLNQGEEYVEPGYLASDTVDGDLTDSVIVTGNVNTNVAGTYTLTYTVSNSTLKTESLTRTIIVNANPLSVILSASSSKYTNNDILITVKVDGSNFTYVKYPDNTVSTKKTSTYKVSKNGTYKFYIYDSNGNYVTKEISIKNIDKDLPSGTCRASIDNGITYINVLATDTTSGVKNYEYYGNNSLLGVNSSNSYQTSTKLTSAYVIVNDNASNSKRIDCQIEKQYDLEVHFINVGREDAIVIRSSEKTIFIDGGTYSQRKIITPYLQDLGITKIDVMIGSHLHYNHIQAQADLLENFEVGTIYYPQDLNTCYSTYCDKADQKYILDAIKKYNKKISIMKVDDNINIGDMNIFCVGPIKFQTKSQNKYRQNYNSLNFILTYGETKFMFTGDYMQYSNILKKFSKSVLDVDVLKYPHHGNATLGKELVNAMSPKFVVLTNSRDELSSRNEKDYLESVGSSFYYSYKHGNILMISDGENITVKTNIDPTDYKR